MFNLLSLTIAGRVSYVEGGLGITLPWRILMFEIGNLERPSYHFMSVLFLDSQNSGISQGKKTRSYEDGKMRGCEKRLDSRLRGNDTFYSLLPYASRFTRSAPRLGSCLGSGLQICALGGRKIAFHAASCSHSPIDTKDRFAYSLFVKKQCFQNVKMVLKKTHPRLSLS